jgi:hypothetical protein
MEKLFVSANTKIIFCFNQKRKKIKLTNFYDLQIPKRVCSKSEEEDDKKKKKYKH